MDCKWECCDLCWVALSQRSTHKLPSIYTGPLLAFSMFKDGLLPHGRCFTEGTFKFVDQLPLLLFTNLYFFFLLWKCSLNKAKGATRVFKTCHLSICQEVFAYVATSPSTVLGESAPTMPEPLKGLSGAGAGGSTWSSPPQAERHSNWVALTEGQMDGGWAGTLAACAVWTQVLCSNSTFRSAIGLPFSSLLLCPHGQCKGSIQNCQI